MILIRLGFTSAYLRKGLIRSMRMNHKLRGILSFIRWRLKPIRLATKFIYRLFYGGKVTVSNSPAPQAGLQYRENLLKNGYCKLEEKIAMPPLFDIAQFRGMSSSHPFVDVANLHWSAFEGFLTKILGSDAIAGSICDYFDGTPWLWNASLNYSDPTDKVSDSQLWHFDYGDTRQLHLMVYFSDVTKKSGPFTFIGAQDSERVGRSKWVIERFTDEDLVQRYGLDVSKKSIKLVGKCGDMYMADPGRVMHQGARCETPRLVMFATFTSTSPMSKGGNITLTKSERLSLYNAYQKTGPNSKFTKDFFI